MQGGTDLRKMTENLSIRARMSTSQKRESLSHPEQGELPARKLLDCIFALTPEGRIRHFHLEQVRTEEVDGGVRYVLTDAPPAPERARCQIIPPFVTEFPKLD